MTSHTSYAYGIKNKYRTYVVQPLYVPISHRQLDDTLKTFSYGIFSHFRWLISSDAVTVAISDWIKNRILSLNETQRVHSVLRNNADFDFVVYMF